MSALLGAVLGFQIGLLIIIVLPLAIVPGLHPALRDRVSNIYYHMAMFGFDRALIARRTNGGVSLVKSKFSGKRGGEKFSLNGDTKIIEDTRNFMRTFMNKPFGLFYEGVNAMVDPMVSEVGYAHAIQHNQDEHYVEDVRFSNEVNPGGKMFTPHVSVPAGRQLVDIANAAAEMHGSTEPHEAETAYIWTVKSQELFSRFDQLKRTMMMLMAFAIGYGCTWFGKTQGSSVTSGSGLPSGGLIGFIAPHAGHVVATIVPNALALLAVVH